MAWRVMPELDYCRARKWRFRTLLCWHHNPDFLPMVYASEKWGWSKIQMTCSKPCENTPAPENNVLKDQPLRKCGQMRRIDAVVSCSINLVGIVRFFFWIVECFLQEAKSFVLLRPSAGCAPSIDFRITYSMLEDSSTWATLPRIPKAFRRKWLQRKHSLKQCLPLPSLFSPLHLRFISLLYICISLFCWHRL